MEQALRSGRRLDVAVIGAGVAGLGAAWLLSSRHNVTLYERNDYLGGHSNTVELRGAGRVAPVDTGFLVYNQGAYPNLTRLFDHFGVVTHPSNMSFAVSIDRGRIEYSGGSYAGLFAQPSNILRARHWRMIRDILRFFREAPTLLADPGDEETLGEFLARERYGEDFIAHHLLPMGAAIWSVPMRAMLGFPARSFVAFFRNHGLLQVDRRPVWRTVTGGSRVYVAALAGALGEGVRLRTEAMRVRTGEHVTVFDRTGRADRFDVAVVATHADEALAILDDASADERQILGAFRYEPNVAVLHQDPALMPRRRRAWASWNYLSEREVPGTELLAARTTVTYWLNRLQGIDDRLPAFLTLNPIRAPRDALIRGIYEYHHPTFDRPALRAQRDLGLLQGRRGLWFCGSYFGFGFHEDALASGLAAAEALGARRPWGVHEGLGGVGGLGYMPDRAVARAGDD
jgi:predicted NAD/FAD-binding protein